MVTDRVRGAIESDEAAATVEYKLITAAFIHDELGDPTTGQQVVMSHDSQTSVAFPDVRPWKVWETGERVRGGSRTEPSTC